MAPLLFIPLVENAFKHGLREELHQAKIDLKLDREEGWLIFTVKNSLPSFEYKSDSQGIGLKNLKRRLDLLYPNKYELKTAKDDNHFLAVLELELA